MLKHQESEKEITLTPKKAAHDMIKSCYYCKIVRVSFISCQSYFFSIICISSELSCEEKKP